MKLKFLLIAFLTSVAIQAQEVLRNYALFEYNSYELTAEAKHLIDSMLSEVGRNKVLKVELYGHTDSDGDAGSNHLLSEQRVLSIKKYLLSKGLGEDIFVIEHFGESMPAYSNSDSNGMKKNRRVEIVFSYDTK